MSLFTTANLTVQPKQGALPLPGPSGHTHSAAFTAFGQTNQKGKAGLKCWEESLETFRKTRNKSMNPEGLTRGPQILSHQQDTSGRSLRNVHVTLTTMESGTDPTAPCKLPSQRQILHGTAGRHMWPQCGWRLNCPSARGCYSGEQ